MKDLNDELDENEEEFVESKKVKFSCPGCEKKIPRDDVVFLCNVCKQDELIEMDGIYMCPSCLTPGENFECMICGSKEVKMAIKNEEA